MMAPHSLQAGASPSPALSSDGGKGGAGAKLLDPAPVLAGDMAGRNLKANQRNYVPKSVMWRLASDRRPLLAEPKDSTT
jgi:hypothetical protein